VGLRTGLDVLHKAELYPVLGIVTCDVMPTLNEFPPPSSASPHFVALRTNAGHGLLIHEISRSRTITHHSRCRTPLDEGSARRRDLYLTTHNTHNRQNSMPPAGFEPTISEGECPQTLDLDRAATGNGFDRGLKCDVTACGGKLIPVGAGVGGGVVWVCGSFSTETDYIPLQLMLQARD